MTVAMFKIRLVMSGARCNHNVAGRQRQSRLPTMKRQLARNPPDLRIDRQKSDFLFQLGQLAFLSCPASAVPQLHRCHVAPGSLAIKHQVFHAFTCWRFQLTQIFDPTRSVHQLHFMASHLASSRMIFKSSWVIKSLNVPRIRAFKAARRRSLLYFSTAVSTASFLVLAPVNLIASSSIFSGISIVVFMLPRYSVIYSVQTNSGILQNCFRNRTSFS